MKRFFCEKKGMEKIGSKEYSTMCYAPLNRLYARVMRDGVSKTPRTEYLLCPRCGQVYKEVQRSLIPLKEG